jgi:hypothetical protein
VTTSELAGSTGSAIVVAMNPLRRVLELAGLKPKDRKKRVPLLSGAVARLKRRR